MVEQYACDPHSELLRICERFEKGPPNLDEIQDWFDRHSGPTHAQFRSDSARHRDGCGRLPLHIACRYAAPIDVIKALVDCDPGTAGEPDGSGSIALHLACVGSAPFEIIAYLCEAHPEGRELRGERNRTALHLYLGRSDGDVTADGAKVVPVLGGTGAASLADEDGMLPMHCACECMPFGGGRDGPLAGASPLERRGAHSRAHDVLGALLELHPNSIAAKDSNGRTPLHLACMNDHRAASPQVVSFLLSRCEEGGRGLMVIEDLHERNPLAYLGKHRAIDGAAANNGHKCLLVIFNVLQDLQDSDFALLQTLPWQLRADAFKNPSMIFCSALNSHMSKPLPVMILLLDFYFLTLLIAFFSMAANETVSCMYTTEGASLSSDSSYSAYLAVIFLSNSYFLLREISQILSLCSIGLFQSVWLSDPKNYIDTLAIMSTFMWFGLMWHSCGSDVTSVDYDPSNEDTGWFRIGMALTSGLYWLSFLLLLRATLVDFAVFMEGMFHVMRSLFTFVISLGVVMVSFAQMFFLVFQQTNVCTCHYTSPQELECPKPEKAASFCTFTDSLLHVYFLMVGEIRTDVIVHTTASTFLACAYILLVVVLLTNVLIAIVTEAYIFVRNSNAAEAFWSNRFAFLFEVKSVTSTLRGWCRRRLNAPARSCGVLKQHEKKKRELWRAQIHAFEESYSGFWSAFYHKITAIVLISVWVLLGFASAGLLWPPQVREYLINQQLTNEKVSEQFGEDMHKEKRKEVRLSDHNRLKGARADVLSDLKRECMEIKEQNAKLADELADMKLMILVLYQRGTDLNQRNLDIMRRGPVTSRRVFTQ